MKINWSNLFTTLGFVVLGVGLLKAASPFTAKIPVVGKYIAI